LNEKQVGRVVGSRAHGPAARQRRGDVVHRRHAAGIRALANGGLLNLALARAAPVMSGPVEVEDVVG